MPTCRAISAVEVPKEQVCFYEDNHKEAHILGSMGRAMMAQVGAARPWTKYITVTFLACFCFIAGGAIGIISPFPFQSAFLDDTRHPSSATAASQTCQPLRIRREWRTLSQPERENYFNAVHCLRKQPAVLANGSLFDDFPYVHKAFGSYSHKSALFLPWHRWFIYLFEEALITHCGYPGALPYWDWVLDWEDITKSPVFDPVSGFGGDGNATGEVTVGGGRCVIDGPFAGLEALRFDANWAPHCLSRGFLQGKVLRKMCGEDIRPEVVGKVLESESFEGFMSALEEGPHIGISTGIRGDWVKFTVPYDPLWYLHHAQLDRLWWTWQHNARGRVLEYNGKSNNNTDARATLSDTMDYGDFVPNMYVRQVMGIESETLCYRYE